MTITVKKNTTKIKNQMRSLKISVKLQSGRGGYRLNILAADCRKIIDLLSGPDKKMGYLSLRAYKERAAEAARELRTIPPFYRAVKILHPRYGVDTSTSTYHVRRSAPRSGCCSIQIACYIPVTKTKWVRDWIDQSEDRTIRMDMVLGDDEDVMLIPDPMVCSHVGLSLKSTSTRTWSDGID